MKWSLPAPDDRVEWSLWTSAIDPAAAPFKREFKDVAVSMGKHAWFTPYYVLYDGEQYGCRVDSHHCGNLCTNAGNYTLFYHYTESHYTECHYMCPVMYMCNVL
jgi:hypothetical protein